MLNLTANPRNTIHWNKIEINVWNEALHRNNKNWWFILTFSHVSILTFSYCYWQEQAFIPWGICSFICSFSLKYNTFFLSSVVSAVTCMVFCICYLIIHLEYSVGTCRSLYAPGGTLGAGGGGGGGDADTLGHHVRYQSLDCHWGH